ncbi:MAG TPA: S1-like domain-containing RNA-binding protein [Pseudosphingobacterium sp.]|nr:S1-like domain-containing RNA-binding protein [Pseudosphingobacterium sp.]
MIEIGKLNTLKVMQVDDVQYILSDGQEEISLPLAHLVPPLPKDSEEVSVFVYTNKEGLPTATMKKPYAAVGHFAYLKVVAENPSGVFMDLGIEKDLFVPKSEQRWPMVKGKSYVVYIYLDEVNKHMVGSAKLQKFTDKEEILLNEGEEVELLIYEETDLGYNAIINNQYKGLLYFNEIFEDLRAGNKRKGWVKKIYPDGKIDLSLHQQGYGHILSTKDVILNILKKNKGHLPLGDKSTPEEIYQAFKISKKAFKKTIGALYKERLISVSDTEITLIVDQTAD